MAPSFPSSGAGDGPPSLRQRKTASSSSETKNIRSENTTDDDDAKMKEAEKRLQQVIVQFAKDQEENYNMLQYLCLFVTALGVLFVAFADQYLVHKYDWFQTAQGAEPLTLQKYLWGEHDPFRTAAMFHALVLSPWWHWATLQISRPETEDNYNLKTPRMTWTKAGFLCPTSVNVGVTLMIVFWGILDDMDAFKAQLLWKLLHFVLLLTNLATLTFSQLMKADVQSTQKMLNIAMKQQQKQREQLGTPRANVETKGHSRQRMTSTSTGGNKL